MSLNCVYVIWKFKSPKNFKGMGGAEKQLLHLMNFLPDSSKEINATVLTKKTENESTSEIINKNAKIKRLTVIDIPFISMICFTFQIFCYLTSLHRKKRIDLIHVYLSDVFIISLKIFSRLFKVPVIIRVAATELYPFQSRGLWRVNRIIVRKLLLRSSYLHVLNELALKIARKYKIKKKKLFLLPNSVPLPPKSKDYSQGKLNHTILYLGALRFDRKKNSIEQKNLKFLIDAFALARKERIRLNLMIVGDGNYRQHLEDYVNQKKLQKHVQFTGYKLDTGKYYLQADLFVNASHYEGMPNTVLEAMSFGLVCVCSRIQEHYEMLGNNEFGLLFNNHNPFDLSKKINDFYKNPKNYYHYGEKARKRIESNYNIEIIGSKLVNLYKLIIKDKKEK